jgi:glycosyltransferase involved in cell wall biosynthesis
MGQVNEFSLESMQTTQAPTVSIIIPIYNRAHTIERALKSVLSQTFTDFEVILVDDASTDDSVIVAKAFLQSSGLRFSILQLSQNSGVSAARNYGILNSSAKWIAFLDSDDEWLPTKLELQLQQLKQDDLLVSHTNEHWRRNGVHLNQQKKHQKTGGYIFLDSLRMCVMSPSTVVIHRSVLQQVGLFDEGIPAHEDYDLWLRVAAIFKVSFCTEPLVIKHGGHADQLSTRYMGSDYFRLLALQKIETQYADKLSDLELNECREWIKKRRDWLGVHYEQMSKGIWPERMQSPNN